MRDNITAIIVGFPRSGTSMLRSILSKNDHLDIFPMEPHFIASALDRFGLEEVPVYECVRDIVGHQKFPDTSVNPAAVEKRVGGSTGPMSDILSSILTEFFGEASSKPAVLKHPALVSRLGDMSHLFGSGLRIIHMVRDPRAAIYSHLSRWPSSSMQHRIQLWNTSVQQARSWGEDNPERFYETRYEDVVQNPEPELTRLCEFLGVPFVESMMQVRVTNHTATGPEIVKGFRSDFRDKWRDNLSALHVRDIERSCGPLMAIYQYDLSEPGVNPLAFSTYRLVDQSRYVLANLYRRLRYGST